LRGRPRNRWKDEVREDGRIVSGERLQGEVYNREEWKKLLRTARNSAHASGMNDAFIISLQLQFQCVCPFTVYSAPSPEPTPKILAPHILHYCCKLLFVCVSNVSSRFENQ